MAAEDGGNPPGLPRDCAKVEELLGVYLLDQVSVRERTIVDRHLAWCSRCREAYDYISVVPDYLDLLTDEEVERMSGRVDDEVGARRGVPGGAHETSGVRLSRATWRRVIAAAAAVLGLVAGSATGVALLRPAGVSSPAVADLIARATDGGTGVSATVVVTPHGSDVAVRVTARGLEPATRYRLYLITSDDRTLAVVEWRSQDGTLSTAGTVAAPIDDIRFLVFGKSDGRVVLSVSFGRGGVAPTQLPQW